MVSPCLYAGLITFLLSAMSHGGAKMLQYYRREGEPILPTYLTHPYIMNKEFRIFIFIKMFLT